MKPISAKNEVTEETFRSTDPEDWRAFFTKKGAATIQLCKELLESSNKKSVELGLEIIASAYLEEDEENVGSVPSFNTLDFSSLVKPLQTLLKKKEFSAKALQCLWVCANKGAKITIDSTVLTPLLEGKEKKVAFKVLVHSLYDSGKEKQLFPLVEKDAALRKSLFEELAEYSSRKYNGEIFIDLVLKDLKGTESTKLRVAISTLLNMVRAHVNISKAVPVLWENYSVWMRSTEVLPVLALHFANIEDYAKLKEWLSDPNPENRLNAWRGINLARLNTPAIQKFLKLPGMMKLLNAAE